MNTVGYTIAAVAMCYCLTAMVTLSGLTGPKDGELQVCRSTAAGAGSAVAPVVAVPRVVPVVVITCKRPDYLERSLDSLLRHRPRGGSVEFPIIVSRDCHHEPTANLLDTRYKDSVIHLVHPAKQMAGDMTSSYGAIARHYRWAMSQVFDKLGYEAAIIVEEDMDVAVDFFSYFGAMLRVLWTDRSVWCVSSWNDNGVPKLAADPHAVFRSDFFPGLGWMLTRDLWRELEPQWPINYWDEFMRKPSVRKGRSCIRPEISRTHNFGEHGVSDGQYYSTHIKLIQANTLDIDWSAKDTSFLERAKYDAEFAKQVAGAEQVTLEKLQSTQALPKSVRVEYRNEDHFVNIAHAIGLMHEWKEKIPRTAYKGVVSFTYRGSRVYLCESASYNNPAVLASPMRGNDNQQ